MKLFIRMKQVVYLSIIIYRLSVKNTPNTLQQGLLFPREDKSLHQQ